jgi:ABC-type lipoprotein export system ATPase subunit
VCAVTLLSGCQAVRADLNNKYIVCKRVVQDAEAKRGFVYKASHFNFIFQQFDVIMQTSVDQTVVVASIGDRTCTRLFKR